MSANLDEILAAFFNEMQQTRERYAAFVQQAEEAGQTQLAKLFRAVIASEAAREQVLRIGLASHANENQDVYVCPRCGLVFIPEAPEQCPVDETPGGLFEKIG